MLMRGQRDEPRKNNWPYVWKIPYSLLLLRDDAGPGSTRYMRFYSRRTPFLFLPFFVSRRSYVDLLLCRRGARETRKMKSRRFHYFVFIWPVRASTPARTYGIYYSRERERGGGGGGGGGGVTCSVLWRECSRNPLSLARSLCDKNYKIVGFVCDARASFTARRVASRCLGGSFVRALTWNMACEKWRGWRVIKDFGLRVE